MARNGSGSYSPPSNSFNPAVDGTTIDQDDWNTLLADIAVALTASIASDGQTVTSAAIPFANGVQVDTISEKTSNTGVTIDGVLLKDGRVDWNKGANIASASSPDIWASNGNVIHITGTTTITDFADAPKAGLVRFVEFDGALTLTHDNAKIDIPGDANITTAAGDRMIVYADSTTLFKVLAYQQSAAGLPASGPASSTDNAIARFDGTTGKTIQNSGWTLDDSDVLTGAGKLAMADNEIERPKIKDYGETVNAIGSIGGGTQDIDLTLGNVVSGTVDTSTTTFTFSNPPATGTAGSFTLILTNGGSQTVNWPASVDWAGGTAPTLTAAGVDILTFLTLDGGTTWYGFSAGADMS